MDPFSAFALACNILQVVEAGVQVLGKAADYRKAENGLLPEQKDLREVANTLNHLNSDLGASLAPEQTKSTKRTVEESRLLEANDQCLRLSKDLINFLNRLKLREKNVVLDSLRVSIKTMWHKDKMDAMEKSLSSARDNLNIAFLVYMNSKQVSQKQYSEMIKGTTRVEGNILHAVAATRSLLQDDIQSLAAQLEDVSLQLAQKPLAQFSALHHDILEQLSQRQDSIFALHADSKVLSDEEQTAAARQNIMDSLQFPQIRERKDHVLEAHSKTYHWILEPKGGGVQRWDDFVLWLRSSSVESQIYWVHGKIGAGKTTLLRYIDDNLSLPEHMLPWAHDVDVVRASCFLWNGGNTLQKSTSGLLRSLLTQFFEQTPDLIPQVVRSKKWQAARLEDNSAIEWSDSELRDLFREYLLCATVSNKVFVLIDGLDECEGTDEVREGLIDLLIDVTAANMNLKICLSSRPWNIFKDAFGSCPQLRLEDLTYNDINLYIQEQFDNNKRFQSLLQYDTAAARQLLISISSKAAGVFLWVRLVVRQLLRGLRDGDSILALHRRVEEIPEDLNEYFMGLMGSIKPQHRKEAAQLLQLALYNEDQFVSLHSNNLLDFSFIEEGRPDFALSPSYKPPKLDMNDAGAMAFRLESIARKVNSRCMGLLECHSDVEKFLRLSLSQVSDEDSSPRTTPTSTSRGHALLKTSSLHASKVFPTARITVDFLHRSLRDFLLTPSVQTLLHHHMHDPYDTRMFFRNARLAQLMALTPEEAAPDTSIGLASYILSTLTVPADQDTPSAARVATILQPIIENMAASGCSKTSSGWYVDCVLSSWREESSTFLTLAIDFGLTSYVRVHLTPQAVHSKQGRPILDYILRPRFGNRSFADCVGNRLPDPTMVETVLSFNAGPNQLYQGVSVWALAICFTADHFRRDDKSQPPDPTLTLIPLPSDDDGAIYLSALQIMLAHGAAVLLPRKWLSDAAFFKSYGGRTWYSKNARERLRQRFPDDTVKPVWRGKASGEDLFAVSGLVDYLAGAVGAKWHEGLREEVVRREGEMLEEKRSA